jgi:hypothetical protein
MFLGILGYARKSSCSAQRSSWADCYGWGHGAVAKRICGLRYVPTRLHLAAAVYRVR